jgi:hypothetical protein
MKFDSFTKHYMGPILKIIYMLIKVIESIYCLHHQCDDGPDIGDSTDV